jgi:hypothetical protein
MSESVITAIQDDPELYFGLTIWGNGWSAQVRDTTLAVYIAEQMTRSSEDGNPALLNVATARGHL